MSTLLCLNWIADKDLCEVQGALLSIMCQSGCERSVGENGHLYLYG